MFESVMMVAAVFQFNVQYMYYLNNSYYIWLL